MGLLTWALHLDEKKLAQCTATPNVRRNDSPAH